MAEDVGARPIWSGTITFGLVNVPVNLYPGIKSGRVRLRMLDENGTPLNRRYYCPADNSEVPADEIIRGYEIEKDLFVIVDDKELEALEPERSRDIDLRRFVDARQIPPFMFERPYFLAPAGQSNKAYRLLARVMEEEGKAGVATFVMREKEYLVAILSENGILRAQTLRFAAEIRKPGDVGLPRREPEQKKEVQRLESVVKKLTKGAFLQAELEDEYTRRLEKLIEKKRKNDKYVVRTEASPEAEADFVDLMALLKKSISKAA
jgi:DNA end-binding protein Ku